jgi:hypothetical protein
MIRISYKEHKGLLKSNTLKTKKGVEYFATVCYTIGEWKIYNAKRRNVVRSGFSMNRNVLRRAVRRNLIELGVEFGKEFTRKGYAKTRGS